LRFGDIHNPHTHHIDHGVVSGIAGYGNPIGVPNLAGDVFYDKAYQDNCLVTVVTLGVVRDDHIVHSYAPKNAVGYNLVLVGKPTDNSGFGGASFASLELSEDEAEQNKGAVQEPNAFLGRHMLKANSALFKKLAEQNRIDDVGFKDLGAGGVACASVEIADGAGYGATVDLEHVHVSMENLPPQVVLCAETQERYLWAVPADLTEMVVKHYNEEWQLPKVSRGARASVIGQVTGDGHYTVRYHGATLVSAKAADVTTGILYDRPHQPRTQSAEPTQELHGTLKAHVLKLLADENLASKKPIFECYDKQVQGRTVIERGEASAGVLQPFNSNEYPAEIRQTGVALSLAQNPKFGKIDAYWTAYNAIISAMRKVVAVGAKPAALSDCLCFGNPEKPEQMQDLIDAIRGLGDACRDVPLYDHRDSPTPIISGNVSLYNESENGAIPASPMIGCVGVLENVDFAVTPHFKQADSKLIMLGKREPGVLPKPEGAVVAKELFVVLDLIRQQALLSCEVIDMGGLAFTLATMSFKNEIGFESTLNLTSAEWCSEASGFVLEVADAKWLEVKAALEHAKVDFAELGATTTTPTLTFDADNALALHQAKTIFNNSLRDLRS